MTRKKNVVKLEAIQEEAARTGSTIQWVVLHRRFDAMPAPPKLKATLEHLGFSSEGGSHKYQYMLGETSAGSIHACAFVTYQRRGDVLIEVWLGCNKLSFHTEKYVKTTLAKSYAVIEQVKGYCDTLNNTQYDFPSYPQMFSQDRKQRDAHEDKYARRIEKVEGLSEEDIFAAEIHKQTFGQKT